MEALPASPCPGAEEGGRIGPVKPKEGKKSDDWGERGQTLFFLTTSTFKKHLGAIHRAGAAAHTFSPWPFHACPEPERFMARTAKNISFRKEMKGNQNTHPAISFKRPRVIGPWACHTQQSVGLVSSADRATDPPVMVLLMRLHKGTWE